MFPFYTVTAHLSKLSKLQTLCGFYQLLPTNVLLVFQDPNQKITLHLDDYFIDLTSDKGFVRIVSKICSLSPMCHMFSSSNHFLY